MVMGSIGQETDVLVIGGGPGGYVAACRVADLGREVILVDERDRLGGVCLLEGCIPSKTLIHAVEVAHLAEDAKRMGLNVGKTSFDIDKLRQHKSTVTTTLCKGIDGLVSSRGIDVVRGRARFSSPHEVRLEGSDTASITFKHCIIASGSSIATIPMLDGLDVWTSREALELPEVPESLLVVGGGYIGLELGFVYAGLGAKVSVVEMLPNLLSGADEDLVKVVEKNARKRFEKIMLGAKLAALVPEKGGGFEATIELDGKRELQKYARVLVAVGRKPNTGDLDLANAGLTANERGLIDIDDRCRTAVPHIFAIGDITPGPMLAHKASRQGKVAAEVIAGHPAAFDNATIPAVVFTDPELAWAGLTEAEAKQQGIEVVIGKFPLSALGRARAMARIEGFTKVIADKESGLVLGVGLVGPHASDMIAEAALAIEMGATLEDIAATVHPHPTLSEALMEAAEVALGACVHLPRR